jgi:hypothetical protein
VRLIAVIAAAAGAALVFASGGRTNGNAPRPIVDPSLEGADGYELIVELSARGGLPSDWRDFLLAKAWIESRGNPLRGRGTSDGAPKNAQIVEDASEARAAGNAYDRQIEKGAIVGSVWGRKSWSFGSGGLWAMLPANAVVVAFRNTELQGVAEAYDPWAVFEPRKAIALALGYSVSLLRWQGYRDNPTWETLHAGWRSPATMSNPGGAGYQKSAANLAAAISAMGLPSNFAQRTPTTSGLPSAVELYLRLNGAAS